MMQQIAEQAAAAARGLCETARLKKGDILLHGHTHVPVCREHDTYVYLNPGSVSIPKEESWHGYLLLEDSHFTWKDLDGNIQMEYDMNQGCEK